MNIQHSRQSVAQAVAALPRFLLRSTWFARVARRRSSSSSSSTSSSSTSAFRAAACAAFRAVSASASAALRADNASETACRANGHGASVAGARWAHTQPAAKRYPGCADCGDVPRSHDGSISTYHLLLRARRAPAEDPAMPVAHSQQKGRTRPPAARGRRS
eukprot:scaffold8033_cov114-Isochrysis_galbana.AAC.6